MATLSELQAWRDSLIESRGQPSAKVEYDGKSVTFKSDADLAAAIADLDRRIATAQGVRVRTMFVSTSKGV
jgi:hypothetical protein